MNFILMKPKLYMELPQIIFRNLHQIQVLDKATLFQPSLLSILPSIKSQTT